MTWFPTTTRGWLIVAALTPLLVGPWVARYIIRQQPATESQEELLCAGPSRFAREEKMDTDELRQGCRHIDPDGRETGEQRHAAVEQRWGVTRGNQ